jgi:SAM-dependent methyltransferase
MSKENKMNGEFKCRICGNDILNQPFIATERLMGFRDEFVYFECSRCGCIQIHEIPQNLSKYYPKHYYSYQEPQFARRLNPILFFFKNSLAKYYIGKFNLLGWILSFFFEHPFPWLKSKLLDFNSQVLDVGCGSGRKLLSMKRSGFKNLTGIDPYNDSDIFYPNGVKVLKKDVFDITDKYDLIMLHHSFEHMDSPLKVLIKFKELLKPGGHLLIRIPVANSYAWRKYKAFWYALDAPRHLFLHSTQSLQLLAERAGLRIDKIEYDSLPIQFINSEKYLRNLSPSDSNDLFTKKEMRYFSKEVKRLNQIGDGDCACFYITKKEEE